MGLQFAADVIADSEVSDGGEMLEIRVPETHFGIDQGDVSKALGRLKWHRQIVIAGGRQAKRSHPAPAPNVAAPARAPITQADIDAEVAKRRQRIPPQMEAGCDLAACSSAAGQ